MNIFTLSFLVRNLLWITGPLLCIGLLLLGSCISGVIKLVKRSQILRVPLAEVQEIEFKELGPVVLCEEGPLLSNRFSKFSYVLIAENGVEVEGRRTLFHAKTSSFSKVRMEVRRYYIPRPGRYTLQIMGLGAAQEKDSKHELVFMRPHLFQAIGYVVGIVFSAGLFITSLVFFLLRLTGNLENV